MSTNAIGSGSANFPINLPVEEKMLLGRAAFAAGSRSVGDFLRKLILKGAEVEDPDLAAKLREIRQRYYSSALLLLICGSVAAPLFGHSLPDMRRASVRVGVVRSAERGTRNEMEGAI